MAGKRKNFYYVLVFTNCGPVYVTDILPKHYAEYNKDKKPKEFGNKEYAQEVATGLMLNFNSAVMVVSPYEITCQPYRYADGQFEWKMEDKND